MKKKICLALISFSLMMTPACAFAAGGSSSILTSPIVPTMTEFLPMLIAFIIVAFVLMKFGWPMIIKMLDARTDTIENSLKSAEEAKLESENILEEYKAKLAEGRTEAADITSEARSTAAEQSAQIIAQAQSEAKNIIEQARVTAETMKRDAAADIRKQTAEAAVAVAAKLIGAQVGAGQASDLTNKYFAEMGSFNDN